MSYAMYVNFTSNQLNPYQWKLINLIKITLLVIASSNINNQAFQQTTQYSQILEKNSFECYNSNRARILIDHTCSSILKTSKHFNEWIIISRRGSDTFEPESVHDIVISVRIIHHFGITRIIYYSEGEVGYRPP